MIIIISFLTVNSTETNPTASPEPDGHRNHKRRKQYRPSEPYGRSASYRTPIASDRRQHLPEPTDFHKPKLTVKPAATDQRL